MGQRRAVTTASATRYKQASKTGKGKVLHELCAMTGWHRTQCELDRRRRAADPVATGRARRLEAVPHQQGLTAAAAEREVTIAPRVNDNRARSKSGRARTVPIGAGLLRLYADYLHEVYRDLDSDYVFVNLWAAPVGQALSYRSVYDLVLRL